MNKLFYIVIILVIGCNSPNRQSSGTTTDQLPDSVKIEMNLYEPHVKLYALLDSIVMTLANCPSPSNTDIIEFVVFVEPRDYGFLMNIGTICDHHWNYTLSTGLFEYNNHRFYYSGPLLKDLIIETETSLEMKFQNPKKMIFDIDDTGYKWVYAIQNGNIEGILLKDCQRLWVNWDYFPGEG